MSRRGRFDLQLVTISFLLDGNQGSKEEGNSRRSEADTEGSSSKVRHEQRRAHRRHGNTAGQQNFRADPNNAQDDNEGEDAFERSRLHEDPGNCVAIRLVNVIEFI